MFWYVEAHGYNLEGEYFADSTEITTLIGGSCTAIDKAMEIFKQRGMIELGQIVECRKVS